MTTPAYTLERDDWNRRYAGKELIWSADANRFLMEETAALAPGLALDLAAGEARNAVWLAERGWRVHAVDFSDVGIGKGRQLATAREVDERIEFEVADLRVCEIPPRRYDLVALIYLQLSRLELDPILRRAAGAVAPGGTFLLVAHDSANLAHGYGGPQHPEVLYSAEQVVAALDGELQVEKAQRVERKVQTADGERIALDCLVRARRA